MKFSKFLNIQSGYLYISLQDICSRNSKNCWRHTGTPSVLVRRRKLTSALMAPGDDERCHPVVQPIASRPQTACARSVVHPTAVDVAAVLFFIAVAALC